MSHFECPSLDWTLFSFGLESQYPSTIQLSEGLLDITDPTAWETTVCAGSVDWDSQPLDRVAAPARECLCRVLVYCVHPLSSHRQHLVQSMHLVEESQRLLDSPASPSGMCLGVSQGVMRRKRTQDSVL